MWAAIWCERGEPAGPAVDDDCARKLAMTKAERRLLLILAACPTGAALDARQVQDLQAGPAETRCAGPVSTRDLCMAPPNGLVVTSYAIRPAGLQAWAFPSLRRPKTMWLRLRRVCRRRPEWSQRGFASGRPAKARRLRRPRVIRIEEAGASGLSRCESLASSQRRA
jgi:hypothetical protein